VKRVLLTLTAFCVASGGVSVFADGGLFGPKKERVESAHIKAVMKGCDSYCRVLVTEKKEIIPLIGGIIPFGTIEKGRVYYVGYRRGEKEPFVIAAEAKTKGWFNDLRFLVGVSRGKAGTDGHRITEVIVLNAEKIHGHEEWLLKNDSFVKQFRGKKVTDGFMVGKDIDAITGATNSTKDSSLGIKLKARKLVRAFSHKGLLAAAAKSAKISLNKTKRE